MVIDKTNAARQKRYRERMQAAGYTRACAWVPRDKERQLHDFAEWLRREAEKKA